MGLVDLVKPTNLKKQNLPLPGGRTAQIAYCQNHIYSFLATATTTLSETSQPPLMFYVHMLAFSYMII